jgi:hypothetical protein
MYLLKLFHSDKDVRKSERAGVDTQLGNSAGFVFKRKLPSILVRKS